MVNFSSRQLRGFLLVAQYQNFTRAAEALYITPSGLSLLIREFEHQLGFRLFDRTTRHVALTAQGAELLGAVRRGLEELEGAMSRVGKQARATNDTLSIGAGLIVAAHILPQALKEFRSRRPELRIEVSDEDLGTILQKVRDGFLDMGVGSFPSAAPIGNSASLGSSRSFFAAGGIAQSLGHHRRHGRSRSRHRHRSVSRAARVSTTSGHDQSAHQPNGADRLLPDPEPRPEALTGGRGICDVSSSLYRAMGGASWLAVGVDHGQESVRAHCVKMRLCSLSRNVWKPERHVRSGPTSPSSGATVCTRNVHHATLTMWSA